MHIFYKVNEEGLLKKKLNAWLYSSEEPRPTEAVAGEEKGYIRIQMINENRIFNIIL